MLTIIKAEKSISSWEEMKARISANITSGKKCVLLVPEQKTVTAELELATALPSSAPLYFEVTNFTRFANSAFRELGGINKTYADKVIKSLILWYTLNDLAPFLKMTEKTHKISAGLVAYVEGALKEAELLGFDAEKLEELAKTFSDNEKLKNKLSDLALIMKDYKGKIAEKYLDSSDNCTALAQKLEENPDFLSGKEIFLEGFTSFTAAQYTLLAQILKGADVFVTLDLPKGAKDAFEYREIAGTEKKLLALCERLGVKPEIKECAHTQSARAEVLEKISTLLWKPNPVEKGARGRKKPSNTLKSVWKNIGKNHNFSLQKSEILRIFEAKTPFEECEFIASDIKRRVMAGASYKDFAIVAANVEDYDGILDTALDKAEINHFVSNTGDLMDFEAVKLIFAAIKAANDFGRADVLAYASSELCGITLDERDEFALYVDKWQLEGAAFYENKIWNMNPLGFESRKMSCHDELLDRINGTRVKLTKPLIALSRGFASAETVKDYAVQTVKFLESIELEKSLYDRAEELRAAGESIEALDTLRLFPLICSALDTLVDAVGSKKTNKESFSAQLKVVFSSSKIGRIPATADEVLIGNADTLRTGEREHVYLIGVNYGKFPAPPSSSSFFTDKDREAFIRENVCLRVGIKMIDTDDRDIRTARGLYSFSRAFDAANRSVTLSYFAQGASFDAQNPSFVIENIAKAMKRHAKIKARDKGGKELCKKLTKRYSVLQKIADMPPRDKFYAVGIAAEAFDECTPEQKAALKEVLGEHNVLVFADGERIDNAELEISSLGSDVYLTQTRIDSYVSCPLKYFCNFVIDISEDKRAVFGMNNVGSYIHAILENFFKEIKEKKIDLKTLDEPEKTRMIDVAARDFLDTLSFEIEASSERMESALEKIKRAAKPVVDNLCDEFKVSAFTPVAFELALSDIEDDGKSRSGKKITPAPSKLKIKGKGDENISVGGTIDRVDLYKKDKEVYVRVVDYKTGNKTFKLENLKKGENLQMFIYLKSVIESEKESFKNSLGIDKDDVLLPAGAVYVHTDISDSKIDKTSDELALTAVDTAQKRIGMVINDVEILKAMGNDKYRPPRLVSGDSAVHGSDTGKVFTLEEWNEISKTVEDAVAKIGHEISAGYMHAQSNKLAKKNKVCEFCEYTAFCRKIKR